MPLRRSARKKTVAKTPDQKSSLSALNASFDVENVDDAELRPTSLESCERILNVASTEITVVEMESGTAVSGEMFAVEDKGEATIEDTVVENDKTDTNLKETSVFRSFLDGEGIARLGEILHNVLEQNSSWVNAELEQLKAEDATVGVTESDADCKGADRDFVEGETVMAKNEEGESAENMGGSSGEREVGIEEERSDLKIGEERLCDFSSAYEDGGHVKDCIGGLKEKDNGVLALPRDVVDTTEVKGGNEKKESILDENDAVLESFVQALEDDDEVGENGDDKNSQAVVMESLGHMDRSPMGKEEDDDEAEGTDDDGEGTDDDEGEGTDNDEGEGTDDDEGEGTDDDEGEGTDDDEGESTDNDDEEEGNLAMRSTMDEDGLHGVGKADEQEEESSGDAIGHRQNMESGHSKDFVEVQNGCDEGELILDDKEDAEGNGDRKEVRTVYVKGLTKSWNKEKLEETCKQFGEVESVRLPHRFGTKHRDFGFIAFVSYASALSCVEAINNGQFEGRDTKIKAELAKSKPWGQERTSRKNNPEQSKVAGMVGQGIEQSCEKSKRNETKGKAVAKVALSELKIGKEGKPNKNKTSFSKQDANPGKTDRKRKKFHPEASNTGNMFPENDERQSKRSRANARDTKTNKNSWRKPQYKRPVHGVEYNIFKHTASAGGYCNQVRVVSISKRHHLDMAPHAGYLEPATKEHCHHYAGYNDSSYGHQQQFHASYHEPTSKNKGRQHLEYLKSNLGREGLPHAGYLEAAVGKECSAVYDQRLMRTRGYDGEGIQEFVYGKGSVAPTRYAQEYSSSVRYQVGGRYDDYGAYPPQRKYHLRTSSRERRFCTCMACFV